MMGASGSSRNEQTMTKPVFQKIYVILGKEDNGQAQRLSEVLFSLFSHVNFTSNLYLVGGELAESMPKVERIQKKASEFLRKNLFARLYVHFVHRVPLAAAGGADFYYQYYYQPWKRMTREFDEEGYMHQEVPRLMLLPVIVPGGQDEPASLTDLLGVLKSAFLLPTMYLDENTFFLAQDQHLLAKTEKVYYGHGNAGGAAEIVCNLYRQDILEDSCVKLGSDPAFLTEPCPVALIVSAQDGMLYGCKEAFLNKESLANIYDKPDVDALVATYYEHTIGKGRCLGCRERVVETSAGLPLPKTTMHEVGALLYHFGTLRQDAEDYVQAVENYEKSLKLSPTEGAGPTCFRIGLCHTKAGRYDLALEAFERAGPTYDEQYFVHFYIGVCYFEQGDYQMALGKFSKAQRMKPEQEDLGRILIYMGTCHNNIGDYEAALVALEGAREAIDSMKEIHSALGFSCFQLKDYDKAIENLNRAVEIDPDSAVDYASLGANYREKGDINTAIAMYEKALELDPCLAAAGENLERLKNKP